MDYMIILSMLGVLAGLYLLVWAGDRVIYYALALSHVFNISSFFVGFVIIAIAADIPELAVAIVSALQGVSQVAAGDIVGANVADVALVLGLTIFYAGSVGIHAADRKKFLYILLGVSILMSCMCIMGSLTKIHGIMLITLYGIFMMWSWYKKNEIQEYVSEYSHQHAPLYPLSKTRVIVFFIASLALIFLLSSFVVQAAVAFAVSLHLPLETVGATLLGMGTSLPELVLGLSALRRKEYGLVLGPTLGTVLCQATLVLGVLIVLSDQPINLVPLRGALVFMFIAFFTIMYSLLKEEINRMTGFALLSIFVGYLAYHFVPLSFNVY